MKHKTWFRLVMKAIGVLLIGLSLPGISMALTSLVQLAYFYANMGGSGFGQQISYEFGRFAGSILEAGLGAYLLFGGTWLVNRCIPSNRPYCHECGYDLTHSAASSSNCPECGVALPPPSSAST